MKKLLTVVLIATALITLFACGGDKEDLSSAERETTDISESQAELSISEDTEASYDSDTTESSESAVETSDTTEETTVDTTTTEEIPAYPDSTSEINDTTEETSFEETTTSEESSAPIETTSAESEEPVETTSEDIPVPTLDWNSPSVAAVVGSVPSPESAYTIISVSANEISFEFADMGGHEEWKQIIQILSDFRYVKEENGVIFYENGTHSITLNGTVAIVTLK